MLFFSALRHPFQALSIGYTAIQTAFTGFFSSTNDSLLIDPNDIEVTPKLAFQLPVVSSCVNLIAGAIAGADIKIKNRAGDVIDSPLSRLLNGRISPYSNKAAFLEGVVTQVLLQGNSYCWINRHSNGIIKNLYKFNYGEVIPLIYGGELCYRVNFGNRNSYPKDLLELAKSRNTGDTSEGGITSLMLDDSEILNFKNSGFDNIRSPSNLEGALNSVKIALAQEIYIREYFLKGTHDKIVITRSGALTPDKKREFAEAWEKSYSGVGKNKPIVIDKSTGITRLGASLKDNQMIDQRSFEVESIARAFRVPSFLINQEAKTTSFGSGISQIYDSFFFSTLEPHIARIEEELNEKLLSGHNYKIVLDTNRFSRLSINERYDVYKKGLEMGLYDTSYVAEKEGLPMSNTIPNNRLEVK